MKKVSLGAKTLVFPLPVWCVGTYDKNGKPNVMTVAWGGICSSVPPSIAVSVRKSRYTYDNLMAHKAFTINVPSVEHAAVTDYFGMVSGKHVDKFAETGLTPVPGDRVHAPYIGEFPMVLECKVTHVHDIGGHIQFVGEILDVKTDENMIGENGLPDIERIQPIVFGPEIRQYRRVGELIGEAFAIGKDSGQRKKD